MKKTLLATVIVLVIAVLLMRCYQFVGCKVAQHDLGYPSSISWVSGKCVVDTPKGKVYLESLRGYGNDTDHQ